MTVFRNNPLLMTVMGANPGRRSGYDRRCYLCRSGKLHNFREHEKAIVYGPQGPVRRNPSFAASLAGGMAGAFVTQALSNPAGPGRVDEDGARELQLYIENESQLYHQQFVPIVRNLMKRRAKGTYNHEKAAKLFLYLVDAGAKKYYREFGTPGVRIFNLATRWEVAKALRDSFETEAELGNYDKMVWGVSNNPTRKSSARKISRPKRPGLKPVKVIQTTTTQKTMMNPGSRGKRKITMTIEQFARWVKAKRDPAMWKAFLAKFRGYEKWTHGAKGRKVTLEWQNVPGMDGLWITYDGGKQPESTYIMRKGSPRKGAWKHEWETMPDIKHDPEAGLVLNKLRGKSRISDFYHK